MKSRARKAPNSMGQLLRRLSEAAGPPGRERAVRDLIRGEIGAAANEIWIDGLGNLIARKASGGKNRLRVMLAARMDEPALIARHIDPRGFVRFDVIGPVSVAYLAGAPVQFENGVRGVIGVDAKTAVGAPSSLQNLFIDVGAPDRASCPVRIGDLAVFGDGFAEAGERWMGRAVAARAGAAILLETVRAVGRTPHELFFAFTTNNQVDGRGTATAASGIEPDVGISIDAVASQDIPHGMQGGIELGHGPVVLVRDAEAISDGDVSRWIEAAARSARIPLQRGSVLDGSLGIAGLQRAGRGALAGALGLPGRFSHSPTEAVDRGDLASAARLLKTLVVTRFRRAQGDGA